MCSYLNVHWALGLRCLNIEHQGGSTEAFPQQDFSVQRTPKGQQRIGRENIPIPFTFWDPDAQTRSSYSVKFLLSDKSVSEPLTPCEAFKWEIPVI